MDWLKWGAECAMILTLITTILLVCIVLPMYLVWLGGWYGIMGLVLFAVLKAISLVYFSDKPY